MAGQLYVITCAVNCILNGGAIICNYMCCELSTEVNTKILLQKMPVSSSVIPMVYVTRRFNMEEAAGNLEDKYVYNESKPQLMCGPPEFHLRSKHYNWQREYGTGTEPAGCLESYRLLIGYH
jgi:transcription elongation factor Elf1